MNLEDAIRCAVDGDALLFVGAGLSFLAHRKDGEPIPDASALVDLLLEQQPGTGSKHPLDRVSGAVVRDRGVEFVYDILRKNFIVHSVEDRLRALYSLPWKRIYTTNYDNAAEFCRLGVHQVSSMTVDEPPSKVASGSIVHLNGFIKRVSPANLQQALLLSDTSYAASRLVKTGWLGFFERDVGTSRAIIFVGYSLYDLEIDRVLLSQSALSRKAFFFISPHADHIEESTLERYGTVITGGIDFLVKNIKSAASEYKAPRFLKRFTYLRKLEAKSGDLPSKPSATTLNQQMVYGRLPTNETLSGVKVFGDQSFLVCRQQDKEAQAAIEQGNWRDVLYIGEIASGKSASSLILSCYLRNCGYEVYYAEKGHLLNEDLMQLSRIDGKVAVVFDGYSLFRENISFYASARPLTHRMILTERSAIHELVANFIQDTAGIGPVLEIALEKIANEDAREFEALTNFGGFWGHIAGASVAARQKYITGTLSGSMYRLLVEIIKSEKVQTEIRSLLEPLAADREASKLFCSALIINSVGFDFTISEWQYLFDRNMIRRIMNGFKPQVQNFLTMDTDQIYARNGVLSTHILHGFLDDCMVKDCLVDLYEVAENRSLDRLRIELVKFSTIEPMFSKGRRQDHIFNYYDSIRVFGQTVNNPDYWLQIGIASTVMEDLERGKKCFDQAYAREKARQRPNLLKIDNYYARFQMKCAVEEDDAAAAFLLFAQAYKRLVTQIFLDTNRHYPFKSGRYFAEIAGKHYDSWDCRQKKAFLSAVRKVMEKALEWKRTSRIHSVDVEVLIREAGHLIRRLDNTSE